MADGLTLAVLGCGTMGIAILSGIMDSLSNSSDPASSTNADKPQPNRLPSKFITCVRSAKSAQRIRDELSAYKSISLEVKENDNLSALQAADVVLLGCKPYMIAGLLSDDKLRDALKGKLLISICAGTTVEQIEKILYPDLSHSEIIDQHLCRVVKAMPNTASKVRESMTVIAAPQPPLPEEDTALINWMFDRIGQTTTLPEANMDAVTALCGSGPAFMALVLEAMADGGVAMGIPRAEAQAMAAQVMRGTTGLVQKGNEHPAILKDKVSTPGGCTIGGLMVLEEGGVRGVVSRAVREATVVATLLGKGVQGVNGTAGEDL